MAVFNEDTRVKIPATIQFLRLGYEYQSLKDMDVHTETRIALHRFWNALNQINGKKYSQSEIMSIVEDIHSSIKNNDLGKSFYQWLINPQEKPKLVDFDNIDNNDFAVVNELTFGKEGAEAEKHGSFRPDITVLINGMPLSFLEVKKPNNEGGIQAEFNRMLNKRLEKPEYKKYYNMLQIVSFSNNMEYEDDDDAAMAEDIKETAKQILHSFGDDNDPGKNISFDSDFENQVYDALKEQGYEVDTQIGIGGYSIDLAIKKNGKYVLGIECDGKLYHSSKSARERDYHRQKYLESRGWRIHRIWSTNWWKDPKREISKICTLVNSLN